MKKKKKDTLTPMEKLTANHEKLFGDKELNNNGKELFKKVVKKATKPRGSK
jgi:hypothetical protein